MKIKIEKEVARPKGHWQVEKWNLLKGETEADAAVINKDNLITDSMVKQLMVTRQTPNTNLYTYLQFSSEVPTVEPTTVTSITDKSYRVIGILSGTPVYFYPSGAPENVAGKEVQGIFNSLQDTSIAEIQMWLKFDNPILLEEGDVLKVSYTLTPINLESAIATGTIPYKTYAYGEDPDDPNAGTLEGEIDFIATYGFASTNSIAPSHYTVIKNPDGSHSYSPDLKFKVKSPVKPFSETTSVLNSVSCTTVVQGTANTRGLTVAFPNTKPEHTPGSYYEVEVDFNVRVLPHV